MVGVEKVALDYLDHRCEAHDRPASGAVQREVWVEAASGTFLVTFVFVDGFREYECEVVDCL